MKHLKTYKIFESTMDDVNDIFMEMRDDGYNVRINKRYKSVYRISINRTDKSYGWDDEGNFNYEKPFKFSEIMEDIDRVIDMLIDTHGDTHVLICDEMRLYNPYEDKKLSRVFENHFDITWDMLKKEMSEDFGLDTLVNSLDLVLSFQAITNILDKL